MRRTTTNEKETKGTHRPGRERLPTLTPLSDLPTPPANLSPAGARAFVVIGRPMLETGRLCEADLPALQAAAAAYSDWLQACEDINLHGTLQTIIRKDGGTELKANPSIAARNEADRRFRGWLQSLGATPSDRSKIVELAAPPEETNPWGELANPAPRPDVQESNR